MPKAVTMCCAIRRHLERASSSLFTGEIYPPGTLRGIVKQAGLTVDEFLGFL
jgi:hypothetical protein